KNTDLKNLTDFGSTLSPPKAHRLAQLVLIVLTFAIAHSFMARRTLHHWSLDEAYPVEGVREVCGSSQMKMPVPRSAARSRACYRSGCSSRRLPEGCYRKRRDKIAFENPIRGTVLEGSVRKAENQVRVTAQLINVQDQGHIWSQKYDRELKGVFAIQ